MQLRDESEELKERTSLQTAYEVLFGFEDDTLQEDMETLLKKHRVVYLFQRKIAHLPKM
jgi:hypothetical protein